MLKKLSLSRYPQLYCRTREEIVLNFPRYFADTKDQSKSAKSNVEPTATDLLCVLVLLDGNAQRYRAISKTGPRASTLCNLVGVFNLKVMY